MPDATRSQQLKLLAAVRKVLRLHSYSLHTERSAVEGIVRVVRCHGRRACAALCPAAPRSAAFLPDLAVHGDVVLPRPRTRR